MFNNMFNNISYEKQANAVKGYIKGEKGYEYSRDSGIMPFLEEIARNDCGVSVKDRRNPLDIVMDLAYQHLSRWMSISQ